MDRNNHIEHFFFPPPPPPQLTELFLYFLFFFPFFTKYLTKRTSWVIPDPDQTLGPHWDHSGGGGGGGEVDLIELKFSPKRVVKKLGSKNVKNGTTPRLINIQ